MTDDLVKRLRKIEGGDKYGSTVWYRNPDGTEAADHIEDLKGQIHLIQSAAKYATKSYEQHLAVYRKALDEKPPVWHDDIQSLQERDAIMTDRIEKLEAALREIVDVRYFGSEGADMECQEMRQIARKALEGKDA